MPCSWLWASAQPWIWYEAWKKVSLWSLKKGKNPNYICSQFCWWNGIVFSFLETNDSWRILWGRKVLTLWRGTKESTVIFLLLPPYSPSNIDSAVPGLQLLSAISIPLISLQVNLTCEFCHCLGSTGVVLFYPSLSALLLTGAWQRALGFGHLSSGVQLNNAHCKQCCLQLGCLFLASEWPKGWAGFWTWVRRKAAILMAFHLLFLLVLSQTGVSIQKQP